MLLPALIQGYTNLKLFILVLLLCNFSLYAENSPKYSLRFQTGFSSANDLDQLYKFQGLNRSDYHTNTIGIDAGYRFVEDLWSLPFDLYAKGGVSYFDENYHQADFLEATLYIKFLWKLNFLGNQIRLGFGEGVSYAGRVPYTEAQEAIREGDNQSNLLNYLDVTADFDLGKLIRVKPLDEVHIGYLIKHRSGVHGLYGGVSDGGSNYNCIYVEKNF